MTINISHIIVLSIQNNVLITLTADFLIPLLKIKQATIPTIIRYINP